MNITRPAASTALAAALALGMVACGSDEDTRPIPSSSAIDMGDGDTGSTTTPAPTTATTGDADDQPIDDETRQRLERVALDEVGDGRVEDVERSDDRSHAYEVDVELAGDDDVTVEISEDFQVVRVDR